LQFGNDYQKLMLVKFIERRKRKEREAAQYAMKSPQEK